MEKKILTEDEKKDNCSLLISNVKSSILMSLKSSLPNPMNGKKINERIKKLGLTLPDFAYLINRSAGGLYNLCCEGHSRYKKGKKNEDILIEIALSYIEKIYEERKQKQKEEKNKEKERVFNLITKDEIVNTCLSLRECNTIENKSKIMEAIISLIEQNKGKITYSEISKITGLAPQQIARIREKDQDVDDWFNYTNEVEFDQMQALLSKIATDTQDTNPNTSIKAMETKMKYLKSNQKDKEGNNNDSNENIWDKFKTMRDVTNNKEKNDEIIIDVDVN